MCVNRYTYIHTYTICMEDVLAYFAQMCFEPFGNVSQISTAHQTSAVPAKTDRKEGKKQIGVGRSHCS